jgi:hypothetical protein
VAWIGKRVWVLLVVIALAALLLAACGGDDDDDGGGNGPTATEAVDGGDDDDGGGDDDGDGGEETSPPDGGGDDDDDGGGGGGNGDVPDVCALLTTDEVSDALGVPVGEGEQSNTDPFFICNWLETEAFDSVSLQVLTGDDDSREFYYELTEDAEELDGLGDRAHYDEIIGVEVITDNYLLAVSISSSDLSDDEVRERSIDLAEKALERLGD